MGLFDKLMAKVESSRAPVAAVKPTPQNEEDKKISETVALAKFLRETHPSTVNKNGKPCNPPLVYSKCSDLAITYAREAIGRKVRQDRKAFSEYALRYISGDSKVLLSLLEGGIVDDLLPSEGINLAAFVAHANGNSFLINKLTEVADKKDYWHLPFCREIQDDILAKYILRLTPEDNIQNLCQSIILGLGTVINEADMRVVLEALEMADERINKTPILMTNPLHGGVKGKYRQVTAEEAKLYNFNETAKVDERTDEHDLVAWKEFSRVIRGADVDTLSPFAGIISKYLPELNHLGVRALVFKVVNKKLVGIKASYFNGKEPIAYGPVEAAFALRDVYPDYNVSETENYYVTCRGFVAGPHVSVYSYIELRPLNLTSIPAAETFLFNKVEGAVLATRLYFYPEVPWAINPAYHNMTVIYGQSDHMFASCGNDTKGELLTPKLRELITEGIQFCGLDNEPALKAAHYFMLDRHAAPEELVNSENPFHKYITELMSDSMFGQTKFTAVKYLRRIGEGGDMGFHSLEEAQLLQAEFDANAAKAKEQGLGASSYDPQYFGSDLNVLLKHLEPLTSRFTLNNYYQNINSGLTKERQITKLGNIPRYSFDKIKQDWMNDYQILAIANGQGIFEPMTFDETLAVLRKHPDLEVSQKLITFMVERNAEDSLWEKNEKFVWFQKMVVGLPIERFFEKQTEVDSDKKVA